ncbi:MAG: hypothetical protein ABIV50_15720 [Opitutus sp.]
MRPHLDPAAIGQKSMREFLQADDFGKPGLIADGRMVIEVSANSLRASPP